MDREEINKWLKEKNVEIGKPLNSGIPRLIKSKYLNDFKRETNSDSNNATELLYLFLNPKVNTKCPICGNPLPFQNFYNGYRKACCKKCSGILTVQNSKQTCINKYGVSNPMKVESLKNKNRKNINDKARLEKARNTLKEKYGVSNPMQIDSVKRKVRSNTIEKYGVDNVAKLDSSKEKAKNTNLKKYGKEWFTQTDKAKEIFKRKREDDLLNRIFNGNRLIDIEPLFKREDYIGVKNFKDKAIYYRFKCKKCGFEFESHLNNGQTPICRHCHPYIRESGVSNEEKEVVSFIKSFYDKIIIENDRSVLKGKELDICLPEDKIAIEYDGLYWHSSQFKEKDYHLNKTIECEKAGIRLIHIFSDEWLNKRPIIESIIKSALGIYERKIGARQCEVKDVVAEDSKIFLEENHLQGYAPASIRKGLYYKDELVSILTISKPRFNREYDWEIVRFCNKLNMQVIGGFEKLFKRSEIKGNVVTYSDRSKFTGNLYKKSFMELAPTQSNYYYVNNDYFKESRMKYQKSKLIKDYPEYKDLTEEEIMSILGYYRFYDCGNWKFEKIS